ncbi:MAG: prepilin-type N-terminal cleavage/methylation domain-containing protein [Elusimicrobiaceae bacterium]|nr:prepilin-type N-terminal cleavage/methylation domain-containing protein [Elusimicrobiaceae bacterium]
MKKAFTLIELLVVVLIIGILAAIALPRYQRAVDKSRYAAMIQTARSIEEAQEVFYLENGYYANDFDELPVSLSKDLPIRDTNRLSIGHAGFNSNANYTSAIYYEEGKSRIASFTLYHRHISNSTTRGQIRCVTYASHKKRGKAICESFGGELISDKDSTCGDTDNTICRTYKLSNL